MKNFLFNEKVFIKKQEVKMKKKILTVLFILTMVLFTACGNSELQTENNKTYEADITSDVSATETLTQKSKEKYNDIDGYTYINFDDALNAYANDEEQRYRNIYIKGTVEEITSQETLLGCTLSVSENGKTWFATISFVNNDENIQKLLKGKNITCFGEYMGWGIKNPSMLVNKILVDGKTYYEKDLKNQNSDNLEEKQTQKTIEELTEQPTPEPTQPPTEKNINETNNSNYQTYDNPQQQNTSEYVLNTHTKKVHKSSCSDVKKIAPENYATTSDLNQALADGYSPCQRCNP